MVTVFQRKRARQLNEIYYIGLAHKKLKAGKS